MHQPQKEPDHCVDKGTDGRETCKPAARVVDRHVNDESNQARHLHSHTQHQAAISKCFADNTSNKTRHRASTSMYSLTFCIRVMSPERHHWKPAVQATAVILRTPPIDGQSPASDPRPLAIYGAQCWECFRHLPVTNQQCAHTPRKLGFALCCHSNATRASIANLPNSAQLGGCLYHALKLHPGPCSNVGIWPQTDTQTRMTTIHFASSTTHAKCNHHALQAGYVLFTDCNGYVL